MIVICYLKTDRRGLSQKVHALSNSGFSDAERR